MRTFELARIAAEAEKLRLRGFVARIVTRLILGAIALVFVLGALGFAHLAAWYWLRVQLGQSFLAASGILGGCDVVIAVLLGLMAARSSPSKTERNALEVRRRAVHGMWTTLNIAQTLMLALRVGNRILRKRDR